MRRQPSGPRREGSVQRYLRQTRIIAIIAVLAFVGGVVSDVTNEGFWGRHALLAGLASSVIVVMLTVGVVNEVVERRRRQRWSILAQYVMFELVRNARMIWTGVLEVAGLGPADASRQESVDADAEIVRDTARLTAAVRAIVADDGRRGQLHDEITLLVDHSNEVLGRWAAVMLNVDLYTEIMDRHVELAGEVAWIGAVLDNANPPQDLRRQRRARSSPAIQIDSNRGGDWLADRLVIITQLAEALDSGTLAIALQIVPVQWWEARLSTTSEVAGKLPDR